MRCNGAVFEVSKIVLMRAGEVFNPLVSQFLERRTAARWHFPDDALLLEAE